MSKRTIKKNNKQRDKSTTKTGCNKAVKQPYYQYIKNKAWKWIKNKYSSESSKYNEYLNKIKILNPSNAQLKKTPLLILFSIVLVFTTAISAADVISTIFKTLSSLIFLENIEIAIKITIQSIILITGFVGCVYFILRRAMGLLIIGIWSSIMIFPFSSSYNENVYATSYFNSFNISTNQYQPHIYYFKGHITGPFYGTDNIYKLHYFVKWSTCNFGIGVNFIAVIYLIIVFLILFQNKKIFSKKRLIIFISIIIILTFVPVIIYSSGKMFEEKEEERRFDLMTKQGELEIRNKDIFEISNKQNNSLRDKCFEYSRSWFNADDKKMIKEVTCYDEDKKITFTK